MNDCVDDVVDDVDDDYGWWIMPQKTFFWKVFICLVVTNGSCLENSSPLLPR